MNYCGEGFIKDGELYFEHICDENGTLCGITRCSDSTYECINGDSTTCEKCKLIFKMIKEL